MYIRKIFLQNVRCLGTDAAPVNIDLQRPDGSFAGWTVFAGRNGSGKSTLLKAVAVALLGPTAARSVEPSFAGWIRRGTDCASLAVELARGNQDGFAGRGAIADADAPFWADVDVIKAEGPEPIVEGHARNLSGKNRERGPWAEDPKGWFLAGYGPFRRLSGHAADTMRLMLGPSRIARVVSLFREDSSLAEAVEWLRNVYLRRLENKPGAAELEQAVLALLSDGLLPGGMKIRRVDSDGLWTDRDGVQLPLTELSDGYRTVAALVLDLLKQLDACYGPLALEMREETPTVPCEGVVLIDEADIHLHVSWQQRIGFWLKSHFPNLQFLVTTHSPFVCQAADPKGIVRLPVPGSDELAALVSDELWRTIVNGGADDATMSELFGLDHTHSEPAERVRARIAVLEARSFRGPLPHAERQELDALRSTLPRGGSLSLELALRAEREMG